MNFLELKNSFSILYITIFDDFCEYQSSKCKNDNRLLMIRIIIPLKIMIKMIKIMIKMIKIIFKCKKKSDCDEIEWMNLMSFSYWYKTI